MNAITVVRNNAKINPKSHEEDNAESKCQPVNLLAFLEAENARLRRTVIELALDTMDMRDALRKNYDGDAIASGVNCRSIRPHVLRPAAKASLSEGVIWLLPAAGPGLPSPPTRGHDDGSR